MFRYLVLVILLCSVDCLADQHQAVAELKSLDGSTKGMVTFKQIDKALTVTVDVTGLTPGSHGFHVHQYGDCTAADGSSAGGHFVGTGELHAGPEADKRHIGDLGNLIADNNMEVKVSFDDEKITLSGEDSIIGRAVVIHAGKDDMTSQPSGDAGGRIACGVIGWANQ